MDELTKFIQVQLLKHPLIIKDSDVLKRAAEQVDDFVADSISRFFLFLSLLCLSLIHVLNFLPRQVFECITDGFKPLVAAFLRAKFHPVFFRIKMHNKMTSTTFKRKVNSIIERTRAYMDTGVGKVVVFVDEFNATSIMGTVKEVFMDHTMDGQPLPSSLLWVGAMNPPRPLTKTSETSNYTGLHSDAPDFIVRAYPPSMDTLVIHISDLSETQERNYLRVLLDSNVRIKELKELGREEKEAMLKWIIRSQTFIRVANLHRVSVSIRGIFNLFYNKHRGSKTIWKIS